MCRIRPILFNTGMVRAILDGRKTATRRIIRQQVWENFVTEAGKVIHYHDQGRGSLEDPLCKAPCRPGDILYVRETWAYVYDLDDADHIIEDTGRYIYYADDPMPFTSWVDPDTGEHREKMPWRPSIHMPRAAARLWLKVKSVKAGHLQEMTLDDFLEEGVVIRPEAFNDPENAYMQARDAFIAIWDSTVPGGQQALYGWDANPWAWAIEFDRCGRPGNKKG